MIVRQYLHRDPVIAAAYLFGCAARVLGVSSTRLNSAERLRELRDYVEVLPGAFGGSVCGCGLRGKTTSTIGFERRYNKAFSIIDRAAFVSFMVSNIPPAPPNAASTRARNLTRRLVPG
jgi:hypothetical protein